MPSFTTSLKDTLSDLASRASSSNTNPKDTSSSTTDKTDSQPQDKNWSQASHTAARAYDDYRQGHSSKATQEIQEAAKSAASAYKSSGGKFDAQDFAGGLVSGLIPGSKTGSGGGRLLPVNLKGEDPEGENKVTSGGGGDERVKSGGGGGDSGGGHEEGVTSVNDPAKEKRSDCGCHATGTLTGTGTEDSFCCATTGSCTDCKGCKASKDSGEDCLCQCQNQKSDTSGEGCACQRQDDSNTQNDQYDGKSSSFKNLGAGAGTGDDYGSNNPLGQASDAINTGQSTVHGFGGRASGLDTGNGDFNPSPSAITAATDELIAGAKNESEIGGGRGTGAYTGGALGGDFGGQD